MAHRPVGHRGDDAGAVGRNRRGLALSIIARRNALSPWWWHSKVRQEFAWAKGINRVVTENVAPEQPVDEAVARIKQILSE
jgi:hypothetical protein